MKKCIFLLIGILAMFFASCTHLNKAFPEELEPYLPYTEKQVVKFQNTDNDTLEVRISNVNIDKEEKVPWNCKCRRSGARHTVIAHNQKEKFTIQFVFRVEKNYATFIFIAYTLDNHNGNINCQFEKLIECTPFIDGVSETIGESVTLESAEGNAIIVKGKGITEFTIGGTKWTLVE